RVMWRSHLALRTVRRACVPGVATLRRSIRRARGPRVLETARSVRPAPPAPRRRGVLCGRIGPLRPQDVGFARVGVGVRGRAVVAAAAGLQAGSRIPPPVVPDD
ncbi:hypothetical protein ABT063_49635, partial [Streptomyces sp. NPDC002838]|uniref:hypothetical protein n=1 Tax=Streptomyces sp. NPDC002838 TaxID=3154436 RepID=UPI0033235FD8